MIQRQRPKRRINILPQIIFLCLTFLAAVSGAYVALSLFWERTEQTEIPQIITVEFIITATPLPVKLVTAVPAAGQRPQVELPTGIAADARDGLAATIDPEALGARDVVISTPTVSIAGGPIQAQNCVYHSILSGDTPFGVALRYGADFQELLDVNDLTIETSQNLQIGDILVVPLKGCVQAVAVDDTSAQEPVAAEQPAIEPTSTPVSAQFEIVAVEGLGDITAESIRLRNIGDRVNMTNWTLSDSDGNSFIFPVTMRFPQDEIVIYTRTGTSTADARFWGKDESVWEAGEELTLRDEQDRVLLTLVIPATAEDG